MQGFLETMGIIFLVILALALVAATCAFFGWLAGLVRKYRDYQQDENIRHDNNRLAAKVDELAAALKVASLPQSAYRGPETEHASLPRPS